MGPLAFVLGVPVSIVKKSHDLTITRADLLKLMSYYWALHIAVLALAYSYCSRLKVNGTLGNCFVRAGASPERIRPDVSN